MVEQLKKAVSDFTNTPVGKFYFKIKDTRCTFGQLVADYPPGAVLKMIQRTFGTSDRPEQKALRRVQLGQSQASRNHQQFVADSLADIQEDQQDLKEQNEAIIAKLDKLSNPFQTDSIVDQGFHGSNFGSA